MFDARGWNWRVGKQWAPPPGLSSIACKCVRGLCNLSGNYSQFWSSASHFHIADSYTNFTLSRHCDEDKVRTLSKMRLCADDWYYDKEAPETSFDCITHLQVPIKKFLTETRHTKNSTLQSNQTFLGLGFQIKWYVILPTRACKCVRGLWTKLEGGNMKNFHNN